MGVDATATLAYGVKIEDDKLEDLICNDESLIPKDFTMVFSGADDYTDIYLCLKDSRLFYFHTDMFDSPLKQEKLIAKSDWNSRVLELCDTLKIKSPKIGWWLLASMS